MIGLRQRYDYDCGVAALRYRLTMLGCSLHAYERDLQWTTPDGGTSHEGMITLARSYEVCFVMTTLPITYVPLFSIVNYEWDRDGHYGVLVGRVDKPNSEIVAIWNPATGRVDEYTAYAFEKRRNPKLYPPKDWLLSLYV